MAGHGHKHICLAQEREQAWQLGIKLAWQVVKLQSQNTTLILGCRCGLRGECMHTNIHLWFCLVRSHCCCFVCLYLLLLFFRYHYL